MDFQISVEGVILYIALLTHKVQVPIDFSGTEVFPARKDRR